MPKPIYPVWFVRCFNHHEDWWGMLLRAPSQYRAEKRALLSQDEDCVYTQAVLYDPKLHGDSNLYEKLDGDI